MTRCPSLLASCTLRANSLLLLYIVMFCDRLYELVVVCSINLASSLIFPGVMNSLKTNEQKNV